MKSRFTNAFTLIEVLVALAILAIALTALMKASSEDIVDTEYLRDKTVAAILIENTLLSVQNGQIQVPYPPYNNAQTYNQLGQRYRVTTTRIKTADSHVDRIEVQVTVADSKSPLVTQSGFAARVEES